MVESAFDRGELQDLLEERALAHDAMDAGRVHRIREDMERAEARRLQPHYIESFFLEAFQRLGGTIHRADLQRRPLDYGELASSRLMTGAAVSAADYINALRVRRDMMNQVNLAFGRYEALVTAISLAPAPPFHPTPHARDWPLQMHMFNLTGHPAMSVPIGLGRERLPMSMQVVGRPFDEAMVFRVGRTIETLSGWDRQELPSIPARVSG